MRLLSATPVLAVMVSAVTAWAAPTPIWQPDKSYDAGPTGPEVDNAPYVGWDLNNSGADFRGFTNPFDGEPAWEDNADDETVGYELDTSAFTLDPNKPLWIEWRYQKNLLGFLGQNHDHEGVRLEVKLGGHQISIRHDGVPGIGDGSWNVSGFNILDGSGQTNLNIGNRLNAVLGEWHTLSVYIVPGTISQSGLMEAEISIDGATDLDENSQTFGNNDKWMFGTSSSTSSSTDITWMARDRDSLMATNHFYWTQVPEPTTLGLLSLGGLVLLRRRRAV